MMDADVYVAWKSNNQIMISRRSAVSHSLPSYISNMQDSLVSLDVQPSLSNTNMAFSFVRPIQLNPIVTSNTPYIYASSNQPPLIPSDPSSSFPRHDWSGNSSGVDFTTLVPPGSNWWGNNNNNNNNNNKGGTGGPGGTGGLWPINNGNNGNNGTGGSWPVWNGTNNGGNTGINNGWNGNNNTNNDRPGFGSGSFSWLHPPIPNVNGTNDSSSQNNSFNSQSEWYLNVLFVHGILLFIAWGIAPFIGVFTLKYVSSWVGVWGNTAHMGIFLVFTCIFSIAGFFHVIVWTPSHFITVHGVSF